MRNHNFSDIYRQEPTFYIPVLKLEIKGRSTFLFLTFFTVVTGGIIFYLLSMLFNWKVALAIDVIYVVVLYFFIDYNINNVDSNQLNPLEKWWLTKRNVGIKFTKKNEKIIVIKKYKTEGVRIWTI